MAAPQKTPKLTSLTAWRQAEEIQRLAAGLLPMMQAIYRAWLKDQSGGTLTDFTQTALFLWLNGLPPGQAEAAYRQMLLEISWLETLTQDFLRFLGEAAP